MTEQGWGHSVFAKEPRDYAVEELVGALRLCGIIPETDLSSRYFLMCYEAQSYFPHPDFDVRPVLLKNSDQSQLELMLKMAGLIASGRDLDIIIHPDVAHSHSLPFKRLTLAERDRLIRDGDWPQIIGFRNPRTFKGID